MAIVTLVLALCSCASRAGVLRGRLVDEFGQQPAGEYTVLLCIVDPRDDTCQLTERYRTDTVAGEFQMRNVPAGQYGIYIISSGGIGTLLLRDEGKPLVIELAAGEDFDLGIVHLRPETPQ
jgi:hypothetical protein